MSFRHGDIFVARTQTLTGGASRRNTRPNILKSFLWILVCAVMITSAPASAQQQPKPNVVWGAFGVYGGQVATPRIDRLASEGMRFNNYNVEAQCTPTRSAIHTARYSVRSGTFRVPLPGEGKAGMTPWEYTIAKLFSDAGYATALFGKWHLGNTQGRLPNDQG